MGRWGLTSIPFPKGFRAPRPTAVPDFDWARYFSFRYLAPLRHDIQASYLRMTPSSHPLTRDHQMMPCRTTLLIASRTPLCFPLQTWEIFPKLSNIYGVQVPRNLDEMHSQSLSSATITL